MPTLEDDESLLDELLRVEVGLSDWEMLRLEEWDRNRDKGIRMTLGQRIKLREIGEQRL